MTVITRFRQPPVRSQRHQELVRWLGCCVPGCRRHSLIEAHHVRRAGTSGTGVKPGDEWCVPLCVVHHNDLHRRGERTCSAEWNTDLEVVAARIAAASRLLGILPASERDMEFAEIIAHHNREHSNDPA